jgi:hypothetical protein
MTAGKEAVGMLANYHTDDFGVLHQTHFTPKVYDEEYLSYYQGLADRTIKLGYQRLGWVLGLLRSLPERVLEIGYGLGTFLEAARLAGVPDCAGCDVARYPLPEGCRFVEWGQLLSEEWTLTALFDVLEHIPDLSFLERLSTRYLAVAVPYCRIRELGSEWFESWRMRLPDEHLHHFDPESLKAFLGQYGYKCLEMNTYEDGLRLRAGETGPNILSAFFEREGTQNHLA